MLRHGCFFGVGILLWYTMKHKSGAGYICLALGLALCGVEIVARAAELRLLYAHKVAAVGAVIGALATFMAAIFSIWLFGRLNDRLRPGALARSVMRQLGLMTYPLYLMHEGVGGVIMSLLRMRGYHQGSALLVGLIGSLVASWFVVLALEPWLRQRLMGMLQTPVDEAQSRFQQMS